MIDHSRLSGPETRWTCNGPELPCRLIFRRTSLIIRRFPTPSSSQQSVVRTISGPNLVVLRNPHWHTTPSSPRSLSQNSTSRSTTRTWRRWGKWRVTWSQQCSVTGGPIWTTIPSWTSSWVFTSRGWFVLFLLSDEQGFHKQACPYVTNPQGRTVVLFLIGMRVYLVDRGLDPVRSSPIGHWDDGWRACVWRRRHPPPQSLWLRVRVWIRTRLWLIFCVI